jgi:hypothetical protein
MTRLAKWSDHITRTDIRDLWRVVARCRINEGDLAGATRARWAAAEVANARCAMSRRTVRRQARLF